MKIRKHFHFTGYVQGVGFRYTAMYAAQSLGLTGYVMNEDDGSVTMEAQGEEESIDLLLKKLNDGRWIRITGVTAEKMPLDPGERSFRTRGY
jgi:acylphosphatase